MRQRRFGNAGIFWCFTFSVLVLFCMDVLPVKHLDVLTALDRRFSLRFHFPVGAASHRDLHLDACAGVEIIGDGYSRRSGVLADVRRTSESETAVRLVAWLPWILLFQP
ncbi:hypothetical protein PR202_ga26012 [Eleusine coracana subsp. coracana]|uniref:Secreted protein n=1 Tax=Eleusine coracana subsp. coracana TaxID=191504 RepID=A0AAV5DCX2_ELECO|nr:hypothetical protein PR202_ga26012 [Eleusine coracana subsp. coracana]